MSRVSLLAAGAVLLLGGCSALGGPKTEIKVYDPVSSVTVDPSWPAADWSLSVGVQAANQILDSARIGVRPTPERFQTYKGVSWADNAPDLVQTALVEGFEDSGKVAAVGRVASGGARGDFALFVELRSFETIYRDGRPEAVIEAQAMLIKLRNGRGVAASKRFRTAVAGSTPDVDSMVAAFGQALSNVSTDIVGWTLVEGDRAQKTPGPAPGDEAAARSD